MLAVLCWAGYTVGLRRLPPGVSPLRVTTVTTIAGTPGLVLAGLPGMLRMQWERGAGRRHGWRWRTRRCSRWWWRICSGTGACKAVGGTRTAIYMCVTPLVAVAAAWVMLGEQPRPLQGVGAVLIIAGVLLTRG